MLTKIIAEELVIATLKAINKAENIIITAHKRPDGDAVGSCLGLYHFLLSQDKQAQVVLPDNFHDSLAFLPGCEDILILDKESEKCQEAIQKADLIFCLDFNDIKRIGALGELIENSEAQIIMVDHHPYSTDFADIKISHPEIASTSELVFRLICRMGYYAEMPLSTKECICAGMMTDTGGLAYNSNSPEIYLIFAQLLKSGVDKDAMYRKLFNTYTESRMRLMGYILERKMEVIDEYNTAIISLTLDELNHFNYKTGDTEGFVNLPLSIDKVNVSIFVREDSKGVKISFRSQGDIPINQFAQETFSGGGHLNAAGGESNLTIDETIEVIKNQLPHFFENLAKK